MFLRENISYIVIRLMTIIEIPHFSFYKTNEESINHVPMMFVRQNTILSFVSRYLVISYIYDINQLS